MNKFRNTLKDRFPWAYESPFIHEAVAKGLVCLEDALGLKKINKKARFTRITLMYKEYPSDLIKLQTAIEQLGNKDHLVLRHETSQGHFQWALFRPESELFLLCEY